MWGPLPSWIPTNSGAFNHQRVGLLREHDASAGRAQGAHCCCPSLMVSGLWFRVYGFGFMVLGLRFRIDGSGVMVSDLWFRFYGFGLMVSGLVFRFRVVGGTGAS